MEDAVTSKEDDNRQSGFQHTDRPRPSSLELFNKELPYLTPKQPSRLLAEHPPGILNWQNTVKLLKQSGKTVVFQWIPGHCGIHGNKQADILAKKGARLPLPLQKPVPYYSTKRYVKQLFKEETASELSELNARISQKHWKTSILDTPCGPRKNAVAIFHLTTGHDILAKHLHRLGIMLSPVCALCNLEDMDRCHALHCSTEVDRYWEARSNMALL